MDEQEYADQVAIVAAVVAASVDTVRQIHAHYRDEHTTSEHDQELLDAFATSIILTLGTIEPDPDDPNSSWAKS